MKKRVLVTASTFPRWQGDSEPRFVLDLCKELVKEFDVTVLAPMTPGAQTEEVLEGIKVKRFHYFLYYNWETLCYPGAIVPRIKEKKVRALLVPFLFISLFWNLWKSRREYDVYHAHWIIPQGIVQAFIKKPYLVTGHGGDVRALNWGIIKQLKKHCLAKARAITLVSDQLANSLFSVPEFAKESFIKKTQIIPMGCKIAEFGPDNRIENYFNQGEKPVVLFVGRLVEIKGVNYLIEAMMGLNATLVVVGTGPEEARLRTQAKRMGIDTHFLGGLEHSELRKVYASADLCCIPSITLKDGSQEGLGLVVLEAMASGLPIIASNSGGITSIVKNGVNGLLVKEKSSDELQEAIKKIIFNCIDKSKIIDEGFKTVKKYDYYEIGKKYIKLLNEISE